MEYRLNGDSMNIGLGVLEVKDCEVYHITTQNFAPNTTCNTKNHIKRKYKGDYKNKIESAAEKVRIELNYSSNIIYPSRYKCLYVCDKNHVHYWFNYMLKHRSVLPHIYKTKLAGILLWTYADLLSLGNYYDYWRAIGDENFQQQEGLFEGEYEILSEHKIDEFPDM